jgi:hypothetical protein
MFLAAKVNEQGQKFCVDFRVKLAQKKRRAEKHDVTNSSIKF